MDKIIFRNGESPYINDTNLNKMQENAEKAINERKPTIELLTVSDTAPSTCAVGDKYYNTTTSKIYTAIATNTWGTEGENPTSLYLYVDLEHKELYYFDGTTFVSYGGGSGGTGGDTLPIGAILPFSSDTVPNGWLLCDGRAVSRTEYAELFKAIGTKHGSGDGSTTFNLPNPKGRTLVGKDSADTDFNELGKTGGEKTHTLTVNEMPKHNHTGGILTTNAIAGNERFYFQQLGATNGENFSNSLKIGEAGGGQPHNNLQPYMTTNFIIKAKNTAVVKGDVIQEDGTASETNVYSSVAMDNKLKTNIVTGQEVATNEYTDDKQRFVKRIDFGALPNTATKSIATGLDYTTINIEDVKGMATRIKDNKKTFLAIPNNGVEVWLSENSLHINCNSDRSAFTGYINIYYTKNT